MRILQITRQRETVGGIGTYVRSLTEGLSALGQECTVLSEEEWVSSPDTAGLLAGGGPADGGRPGDFVGAVLAHVGTRAPDVVLVHHMRSGPLLQGLLDRRLPVAEVVHGFACAPGKLFRRGDRVCTHAVGPRCLWDWYAGPCGSRLNPASPLSDHRQAVSYLRALRQLRRTFVLSEFMRDYLVGEGVAPEHIRVVDWSPPFPDRPRQHRPGGSGAGRRVLYVGRLVYAKGVQYLLAAMARLPADYSLHVAGEGYHRSFLEQEGRRLGIADRVTFTGPLDPPAVGAEYAAADVVAMPSIWPEPLGLVVAEAASHGCPVVVSAVGGLPEWRKRGVDVTTCRPADAAALARALEDACRAGTGAPGRPGASVGSPGDYSSSMLDELSRLSATASG